ncbi:Ty3/Gypsy family RNase HI domain-containing protein, partial [Paenibacillus thiaminolyticus]|uniref:Ty3/Gypsy family RNase HI domain-containing protein n=1 Tax=Paenibacillus thiaminolyticus TaxID=49283 RepID=UPI002282F8B4
DKSEYEKQGILFAGLWVYSGGQGPNYKKLREVDSLPLPRTKKEKQSALGLVSYLRDHIPLLAHFTHCLYPGGSELPEGEYKREWAKLKQHIKRAVTQLHAFSQHEDADLYVDASNKGASAVLIQHGRIVALATRQLNPTEQRYSATDREHLAILLASEKFRIYLHRPEGETRVHTDHMSLLNRKTTDITPRQARWQWLIGYWITNVRHVKGVNNPADFFSRWHIGETLGGVKTT